MSIFSQVQLQRPKHNTFNLSHDRKMSVQFGKLTPILVQETVPNETWHIKSNQLVRFAPLIAPVMHAFNIYTHFFFVPNRLLWDNWEDFITGGEDGTANPAFPTLTYGSSNFAVGKLPDYLGLPVQQTFETDYQVNALPFSAYQFIYNEYYRDQNLITEKGYKAVDGNNTGISTTLQSRAYMHDYFTSCLPFTQKGAEATIPLGDTADVFFNNPSVPTTVNDTGLTNIPAIYNDIETNNLGGSPTQEMVYDAGGGTRRTLAVNNSGSLKVNLTTATAATINDLRNAFRLQEWLEKNARGGSRYNESILVHFGINAGDARLQRPEYIGGGSTPVQISEVLQTSANTSEPTPQGNMAGHGIAMGRNGSVRYKTREHGFIMGIMSVMPKTGYDQGVPKIYRKFDKFDYYFPSFAHLGEQPVLNEELYLNDDAFNQDTFGYLPRYAEYKYIPSSVHGEFRTTLDFWHLSRQFASRPALNLQFIQMQPDNADRIFAVPEAEDKLYCYINNQIKAKRPMPYFGTPKGV